ncbi:MAG: tRNA glutamyl-Q(34) synthetase GluQRS [Ilumatobacter sp.]
MSGRFAPSPTGDLHLGNLRTAVLAWLAARSTGRDFLVRMEDLDRVQAAPEHEASQLRDLEALGLDWDGEVLRQSERFHLYRDALATLRDRGLVYDCYCSRREVRAEIEASPSAPHLPPGSYPGTCRELTDAQRAAHIARGRPPAIRLRATESMDDTTVIGFTDAVAGPFEGGVDDVVLQRNDGVPAYNLAVVIDDALQGVDQVIRGDDLLDSTPRQIHLQRLLDLPTPDYGHVPLVFGTDGERLSKRHGSVSLAELATDGVAPVAVLRSLLASMELAGSSIEPDIGAAELMQHAAERFDLTLTPSAPIVFDPATTIDGASRLRKRM